MVTQWFRLVSVCILWSLLIGLFPQPSLARSSAPSSVGVAPPVVAPSVPAVLRQAISTGDATNDLLQQLGVPFKPKVTPQDWQHVLDSQADPQATAPLTAITAVAFNQATGSNHWTTRPHTVIDRQGDLHAVFLSTASSWGPNGFYYTTTLHPERGAIAILQWLWIWVVHSVRYGRGNLGCPLGARHAPLPLF